MDTYAAILVGFIIGILVTSIIKYFQTAHGTMRIDTSNPDKDIFRLEVDGNIDTLRFKKQITFKIDADANLSQN